MFCLRCGTEVPRLVRECPACGAPVSGLGNAPPDEAAATATKTAAAPRATASSPDLHAASTGPSIAAGGLETPGPPRDALGRVVLAVAVILAADELLPWVVVNNTTYMALTQFGFPAVLLVVLLGLAVIPVLVPSFRAHPVWSALPFAMSALCLGFAVAVWLLLSPLANLAAITNTPTSGLGISAVHTVVILPHWGLYLFVLGSLALVVAGYRLLQAAREAPDAALLAMSPRQAAERSTAASASASMDVPQSSTEDMPAEAYADGAANGSLPGAAVPEAPSLSIPLPGSASWNQEPALPVPLRAKPTGPWRSQSVPPRGH
jgi:hypothetical protein